MRIICPIIGYYIQLQRDLQLEIIGRSEIWNLMG